MFDLYVRLWGRRAEKRAWRNQEWAEIERRRIDDSGSGHWAMFDDELGLTMTEWERQQEIFDEMNPRPAFMRFGFWWRRTTEDWIFRPPLLRAFLQRGRRGYSDRDTWSLDSYLSEVIAGSVQNLARVTNGHPRELTQQEWQDILDRISAGFRSAQRRQWWDIDPAERLGAEAELDQTFALLRRWWGHLGW
jgi:hypothetical protein